MNVRITDIDGKKPSFVQWDVDRVLYIEGTDSQPCLHFANPMLTRAIVVQAEADGSRWVCTVPNIILQTAAPIVISVFVQPDEGKTVLTDWVKVQPKMKPQDYTYEENIGYTNWVQKTQEAEELLATLEETCDQAQDLVEDIQGRLDRKELQGNSIWTTTETPMPATGGVAFTQLTGRSAVPPIVGDIIIRSSRYVYDVVEVTSGGVVIGHLIGDIKGEQGVADAIWRTTASIGSVYPSGYVVSKSDLVGRTGVSPKAGDLVIGPETGETGVPSYLYVISSISGSSAWLDGVGSIKGATGAQGPQGPGVTEDLRAALLQLAQKVAYVDEHGADYYQDLYNALYLPSDIVFITAVFNQGTTKVMDTDSLDSLKPMLTVFGRYDDNTSVVLTNYTLTGVLTPGTSTVTVSALGKTTTFDVFVTGMTSISAVYTQSGTVYDTDTLDSLKADLVVTANYSDSSTQTVPAADYTLSGTLTVGTSTITVAYGGKTTTFSVTVEQFWTFEWDYSMGKLEEQTGWKTEGTGSSSIEQNSERIEVADNNYYQIFPGTGNPVKSMTDGYGVVEVTFVGHLDMSSTGKQNFRVACSKDATARIQTLINKGKFRIYDNNTVANMTPFADYVNDTEYTERIVLKGTTADVYLNGIKVLNNVSATQTIAGSTNYLMPQNIGSGYYIDLKSYKIRVGEA